MLDLMAKLREMDKPDSLDSTLPLEAGLASAMEARDEQTFDALAREWEAYRRPKPLMSWGAYHLDGWGMDRALALGVDFKKEHLAAYFDRLLVSSLQLPKCQQPHVLKVWPAIWKHLKEEPGFADDALLGACLLWTRAPLGYVSVDWGVPAFADLMSHKPQEGRLVCARDQAIYRVTPLQLAWIGADVSLCQALLVGGADPHQVYPGTSWRGWTFAKATQDLASLLRETEIMSPNQPKPVQDRRVSDLCLWAQNHRQRLPKHNEAALAALVRWVPLEQALPSASPSLAKPRF
jgi:hypothetical protein